MMVRASTKDWVYRGHLTGPWRYSDQLLDAVRAPVVRVNSDRWEWVHHSIFFQSPQPSDQKKAPFLFGMSMVVRPE